VDLLLGSDPAKAQAPRPSLATGPVPVVHVATTPSELIVTEGEPNLVPIGGDAQLLYVKNTSGHVFQHLVDQKTYVLVSGRWFRAASPSGPWEFVAPDALPADFAKIPDDSPKENVKAAGGGYPAGRGGADRRPHSPDRQGRSQAGPDHTPEVRRRAAGAGHRGDEPPVRGQ
jgi:hypothetical protein